MFFFENVQVSAAKIDRQQVKGLSLPPGTQRVGEVALPMGGVLNTEGTWIYDGNQTEKIK